MQNTPSKPAQTPTTPSKQSRQDPLQLSDLISGRFYLVKLLFPSSINEDSPLRHHVTIPGETPIFRVDHLYHGPDKAGFWGVDRKKHGKTVFRTCLVVKRLERSVYILVGSTSPSHPRRWLPMEGFQPLPSQPATSVLSYPPKAFANNQKPLFLCYTHVFQVTPVLKHSPALSLWEPGLVHIAPMNVQKVFCKDLDEIRREHRIYWLGKEDSFPDLGDGSGNNTAEEDGSDQYRTNSDRSGEGAASGGGTVGGTVGGTAGGTAGAKGARGGATDKEEPMGISTLGTRGAEDATDGGIVNRKRGRKEDEKDEKDALDIKVKQAKWKSPASLSESSFALFPSVHADAPQWTADDVAEIDPIPMKPLTAEEDKVFREEMSHLSFVSDEENDDDEEDDDEEEGEELEQLKQTIELPGEFYEIEVETEAEANEAGFEIMPQTSVGIF